MDDKERLAFYLTDYQMKVDFLKGHFARLWTRFNFFLTVELGLFGFLGFLLFEKNDSRAYQAALLLCGLGLLVSLIWYFVGRQDRALVRIYRRAINHIAGKIATIKGLEWYKEHAAGAKKPYLDGINYHEKFSITQLPKWLGFTFSIVWVLVFVLLLIYFPLFTTETVSTNPN